MFKTWVKVLGLAALVAVVGFCPIQAVTAADVGNNFSLLSSTTWLDDEDAAADAGCCLGDCGQCNSCCGCCDPGVFFDAEYFNWAVNRSQPYAAVQTSAYPALVIDGRNVPSSRDSGFRLNGGYLTRGGWDIAFEYTYFFNTAADAVADTAANPVFATQMHPFFVTAIPGFAPGPENLGTVRLTGGFAAAAIQLDYDVYDLNIGKRWDPLETLSLRAFGGLRWAQMDQLSTIAYAGTNGQGGVFADAIASRSTIGACGLRAGGEMDWRINGSNLSLFSRAAVSVLYANLNGTRAELATGLDGGRIGAVSPEAIIVSVRDRGTVPVIEVAAGVKLERGPFEFALGYELASWFNMATDIRMVDDYDLVQGEFERDTLGFDGFFFRAGFIY